MQINNECYYPQLVQNIDHNITYKFVAKGGDRSWFMQGTQAFLQWWFLPQSIDNTKLLSLEQLQSNSQYCGLFRGMRKCQGQFRGKQIGEVYIGSDICSLGQFEITYRDK